MGMNSSPASKGVPISLESLQLCLLNAERLFQDSLEVSSATRAGLLELALEEASKGWMVLFAFYQREASRFTEQLGKPDAVPIEPTIAYMLQQNALLSRYLNAHQQSEVRSYLEKHKEILLNPPLSDAFERHEVKLDFLSFLVGYMKLVIPMLSGSPAGLHNIASRVGPAFHPAVLAELPENEMSAASLKAINEENLRVLKVVKEQGFYVNFDAGRGLLRFPSYPEQLNELLEHLVEIVTQSLRAEFETLTSPWPTVGRS